MTTFAEQVAGDDLDVFFNTDEHAATYSYNGTGIPCIVDERTEEVDGAVVDTAYLLVLASDVPSPDYRDTVVIGSDTWRVQEGPYSRTDGQVWRLPIVKDERPIL
jgi:hypothetical protein